MALNPQQRCFVLKQKMITEMGSQNAKDIDRGCPTTIETTTPHPIHPRLIENLRGLGEKTVKARGPECLLWGDRVFQTQQGSCTHEIPALCLPKQHLHNDNTGWHANMYDGNFTRFQFLNEELMAINDCWERENRFSSGMSVLLAYTTSSGQP